MSSDLERLIANLRTKGVLRSKKIEEALFAIDRKDFARPSYRDAAYDDIALPIGYGQTISQPLTVVFMLELLAAKSGNSILEVGYGSCWQTALLAHIVGHTGKVYAMERVPALCAFGEDNLKKYPDILERIELHCRDASGGLPDMAKVFGGFDRIIAAASVHEVPDAWRYQLKEDGILVYPSQGSLFKEQKKRGRYRVHEFPGFAFVPFIRDDAQ